MLNFFLLNIKNFRSIHYLKQGTLTRNCSPRTAFESWQAANGFIAIMTAFIQATEEDTLLRYRPTRKYR